jgi:hypothetical protein
MDGLLMSVLLLGFWQWLPTTFGWLQPLCLLSQPAREVGLQAHWILLQCICTILPPLQIKPDLLHRWICMLCWDGCYLSTTLLKEQQ